LLFVQKQKPESKSTVRHYVSATLTSLDDAIETIDEIETGEMIETGTEEGTIYPTTLFTVKWLLYGCCIVAVWLLYGRCMVAVWLLCGRCEMCIVEG